MGTKQRLLGLLSALAAAALLPEQAPAQAPAPYEATPALVEAARKEGRPSGTPRPMSRSSERMAKLFEAKYPGMRVQVERSGAERVFQRINQEYGSNIKNVDVVKTSDAVHFIVFKRKGWLAHAVPSDVASTGRRTRRTPRATIAAYRAHLSVMGYNTKLLKAEDAPTSRANLLDAKWRSTPRQSASGLQRDGAQRHVRHHQYAPSAGTISPSWRNCGSCRCSPRPSRPRSSRSASAS